MGLEVSSCYATVVSGLLIHCTVASLWHALPAVSRACGGTGARTFVFGRAKLRCCTCRWQKQVEIYFKACRKRTGTSELKGRNIVIAEKAKETISASGNAGTPGTRCVGYTHVFSCAHAHVVIVDKNTTSTIAAFHYNTIDNLGSSWIVHRGWIIVDRLSWISVILDRSTMIDPR